MIDDLNSDELIEQYLLGKFSGAQLLLFEKKLASDEQLRREVALQKAIIENVRAVGRKDWKLKLKGFHQEMEANSAPSLQDNTKIRPLKWFYVKRHVSAVAAVLLLVIVSTTLVKTKHNTADSDRIFLAYYQPYQNIEQTTRGEPSSVLNERAKAFSAYDNGSYHESVIYFESTLKKGENEIALFYLGNAYLSDNKPEKAEQAFKNYLAHYKEFETEAKWYLSLSYLKQGKDKEAKVFLEQLAKENNIFSKKAGEILNKL